MGICVLFWPIFSLSSLREIEKGCMNASITIRIPQIHQLNGTIDWRHLLTFWIALKPYNLTNSEPRFSSYLPVFLIISLGFTTYQSTIVILAKLYTKPQNAIFDRNVSAMFRQHSIANMDQFTQKLELGYKDFNFQSVAAKENKGAHRDAFITGLQWQMIRQHLLGNLSPIL